MKKILFTSLIALTLVSTVGNKANAEEAAGLFVEPGLTYEFSDTARANYPAPLGSSDGSLKGFGLMGRLGFHVNDIVFVAADGRYSRPKFKNDTANYESDANAYNWGVTAGIQMPVAGLRIWGSWVAGGMVDPDAANGLDVKFSSGSGWRVGAGLHVVAVSVNFEYQNITYDNLEIQEVGPFNTSTSFSGTELVTKAYVVSLSFPVSL
jgi:hypothetical protein